MTGGSLEGLVIADFSRVLAGPYATMLLGDLGAEVVKIEHPTAGDDTRKWGPPWSDGESTYFQAVNRNKTGVTCDLKSPAGRESALELCRTADVVIENFRTGAMERLGLDYGALRQINPGLVYCSITGFGSLEGKTMAGYDLLAQAVGGLMSITGQTDGTPTKVGVAVVDVLAGLHAFGGILAALRHRDRTGAGQRLEINLLSSLLSALTNQVSGFLGSGIVPRAQGNQHPSICPYELIDTADRPLALAVGTDGQFRALAQEIGRPQLADDDRFSTNSARVEHRDQLIAELADLLSSSTADDWAARFTARGIPAGPVNDISEAVTFAANLGLEPVVEIIGKGSSTARQIANPMRLSATPPQYESAPAALGDSQPLATFLAHRANQRT